MVVPYVTLFIFSTNPAPEIRFLSRRNLEWTRARHKKNTGAAGKPATPAPHHTRSIRNGVPPAQPFAPAGFAMPCLMTSTAAVIPAPDCGTL